MNTVLLISKPTQKAQSSRPHRKIAIFRQYLAVFWRNLACFWYWCLLALCWGQTRANVGAFKLRLAVICWQKPMNNNQISGPVCSVGKRWVVGKSREDVGSISDYWKVEMHLTLTACFSLALAVFSCRKY